MLKVIAGLGNPGPGYQNTRHNAGFMLADVLREKLDAGPWKSWKDGECSRASLPGGGELHIIKPMTYMNNSGLMVGAFCRFYKVSPAELLVTYDDMALECGRVRLRLSGSAGGHNGMSSVLSHLGSQSVPRLRIGVGSCREGGAGWKNFVLSGFSKTEKEAFEQGLALAADAAMLAVDRGVEAAMNKYNAAKPAGC